MEYTPGAFCWQDLGTPDTTEAKAFYSSLFGWEFIDYPIESGGQYCMAVVGKKDAAALYEQKDSGLPPQWLVYISVESADEAVEQANELGGTVLQGAFDVLDSGRMALIKDPTGGIFAAWEAKKHPGATAKDGPGTVCWYELATSNHDQAADFYQSMFGWKLKDSNSPGVTYSEILTDKHPVGGIMGMTKEWGNVPSHWSIYFTVAHCDTAAKKTIELGGKLIVAPRDISKVGRFSVASDPQGAKFAMIQMQK